MSILTENWHAIEGPNGQCACGPEKGRCGDRLAAFIESLRLNICPECGEPETKFSRLCQREDCPFLTVINSEPK